jgi:hypothetical protein
VCCSCDSFKHKLVKIETFKIHEKSISHFKCADILSAQSNPEKTPVCTKKKTRLNKKRFKN